MYVVETWVYICDIKLRFVIRKEAEKWFTFGKYG